MNFKTALISCMFLIVFRYINLQRLYIDIFQDSYEMSLLPKVNIDKLSFFVKVTKCR